MRRPGIPNVRVPELVRSILQARLSERCVKGLGEVSQEVIGVLTARA
jgi:hypothetical protein